MNKQNENKTNDGKKQAYEAPKLTRHEGLVDVTSNALAEPIMSIKVSPIVTPKDR